MCLQVEGGNVASGTPVVLEPCNDAIASGDGRELFKFNTHSQIVAQAGNGTFCVAAKELASGGYDVLLQPCAGALETKGMFSDFEITHDAQLKVNPTGGDFCIAAIGDKAGTRNVALKKTAIVSKEISSLALGSDPDVMVSFCVPYAVRISRPKGSLTCLVLRTFLPVTLQLDGSSLTTWSSKEFEEGETLEGSITVDLGIPFDVSERPDPLCLAFSTTFLNRRSKIPPSMLLQLSSLEITWSRPAVAYDVYTSEDGTSWSEVVHKIANPLYRTKDSLGYKTAQYVKIVLKEAHPEFALSASGKLAYGIKTLSVMSNRLKTSESCASSVGLAVLKWNLAKLRCPLFSVQRFCPASKVFLVHVGAIDNAAALTLRDSGKSLKDVISSLDEKAKFLEVSYSPMKRCKTINFARANRLAELDGEISTLETKVLSKGGEGVGKKLGDSRYNSAEDCKKVKLDNPEAQTGFFWIQHRCSSFPAKVYCDMAKENSIYVYKGESQDVPGDMVNKYISDPSDVEYQCARVGMEPLTITSSDIAEVFTALTRMGFDKKKAFVRKNAVGLNTQTGKLEYFDFPSEPIGAVVCMKAEETEQYKLMSCTASPNDFPELFPDDTAEAVVRCPKRCSTYLEIGTVIGTGTYKDDSSICMSALHYGVLSTGGLVKVSMGKGLSRYDGSESNGIKSKTYFKEKAKRSFVLHRVKETCPMDKLKAKLRAAPAPPAISLLEHVKSEMSLLNPKSGPFDTTYQIEEVQRRLETMAASIDSQTVSVLSANR
uniref:LCCL domain-containing protein n=1 Tax=Chromera velia CCMP2878 TaxID=1169474 RepID=A0A0G4GP62_9ALVE|eukprot:Cvel_22769.t1-p1 / transcript=Cvel_22769.t1 / gene=Cvel_22769 / organism=Chromera_velia_CCMP2878 / gene_product=hypothetical protein / transcript_product=hypothetical protein / location=Cvel_scaffold2275:18044-21232(+) / protein_length=770 / sequence_SO=supercontig / SO=protein_coding / is_pseudo=false